MALGDVLVAILGLAGALLVGLAVVAWRNQRTPGARWFVGMAAFGAAWVLVDAAGLGLVGPGFLRLYLGNLVAVASICAAVCWVGFVLSYTGRSHYLTWPRLVALCLLPAATVSVLLLRPESALIQHSWEFESVAGLTLFSIDGGPLLLLVEAYLFLLVGGLFVVLLRTIATESGPMRGQLWSLIAGSLLILAGVAVDILDLVPLDVVVTDLSVAVAVTLFGFALFRQRLLALVPAVSTLGAAAAVADLDDGVLIADADGAIVRCNPAAATALGVTADAVIGTDLDSHLPSISLSEGEWTVTRRGRSYRVTSSAITDGRDRRTVGWTVLLRDVTPLERREQRLAVLNRLLRHNLRNDVDAIQKHAAAIRDRSEGSVADSAETIDRLALELAALGDKARLAEDALDVEQSAPATVALEDLLEDVRETLSSEYPAAVVTLRSDANASVRTHERPLRLAIRNVLENALEHGGEAPTVEVTVSRTATGVEIAVADDGPGIPEAEHAVLEDGTERQLDHGSGIGLWLVHWAVAALEGTASFESMAEGTRVTLRIPDLAGTGGGDGADGTPP